jgi:hypothetical protein
MPSRRYEIPVRFYIEVNEDGEHLEMGSADVPYPYDVYKAVPRLLRELATKLEESTHDRAKAR